MTTRNNNSNHGSSFGTKPTKASVRNGLASQTSNSSKKDSYSGSRPISSKKPRKLSDSNLRLRGLNNNIANVNGLASSELSRSQNSRGGSRGQMHGGGMPMLHNRLSQTGFSNGGGGLGSISGQASFHRKSNYDGK